MAMFSNDVRVVNTATPAFHTEPNVTQYGWTKSDAAYYNQLIQYVDEARQIYEYISEKVIYFDGVLSKLANIEDVIDFMVQKAGEVAEDAREVKTTAAYITQAKADFEIKYTNFNKDYTQFNAKYANFNILYDDVKKKAYEVHLDANQTHEDYLATKALYEDLKSGQVYRGIWNPQVTGDYPDGGGTNSTWDVTLNVGTTSFEAQGKTWRSGDRLIYALVEAKYYQINTGSGVDSINGKTGSVTLGFADVGAAPDGYGLGESGQSLSGKSCNDALNGGFYSILADTKDTPYGSGPSGSTMIVAKWASSGAGINQMFFDYTNDRVHFRRRSASIWQPWQEIYHTGNKPTAADVNAVGLSGNSTVGGGLTASFFRAISTKGFVSDARENQGMFMDGPGVNHRTIIGGGGGKADITGEVYIRPNGFTEAQGQTVFTAFGQISNPVDPQTDAHLTNKKYVDLVTKAEEKPATGEGLLMRVGGARDQEIDVALAGATGGAFVAELAPLNPFQGARWFDTNDGRTYIYYDDGDSKQWVEENPQSADVMAGSARLAKLADEGILEVAVGKKSAIVVNSGSSISYQDQSYTVFHTNAEGNSLEWSQGLNGENTLMTLAADGQLYVEGQINAKSGLNFNGRMLVKPTLGSDAITITNNPNPSAASNATGISAYDVTNAAREWGVGGFYESGVLRYAYYGQGRSPWANGLRVYPDRVEFNNGIKAPRLELAAGNISSKAPSIMEVNADSYNFITGKLGSHLCANAYWDGTSWLKNDNSKPSMHAVVDINEEFKVFSSKGGETSSIARKPLNLTGDGNMVVAGEVKSRRSLIADNNYAGVELLIPGIQAAMMYIDKAGGNMRFVRSDGRGGETLAYANFHDDGLSFYRQSNFASGITAQNIVISQSGFRANSLYASMEFHSPGKLGMIWYIEPADSTFRLGQTNGQGAVSHNIAVFYPNSSNFLVAGEIHTGSGNGRLMNNGMVAGSVWGGDTTIADWCRRSFAPISDEKLKRDIQPATKSALNNVAKIKFHSYDWIDGKTKSTNIGMVAQELEEIDPSYAHDIETFKEDGSVDTSVKALDTANLLSLALKAIQELEARIKELEEKVNG